MADTTTHPSAAEVSGFLRRAATSSSIPKRTAPAAGLEAASASGPAASSTFSSSSSFIGNTSPVSGAAAHKHAGASGGTTRLRSRSLLTLDTSGRGAAAAGCMPDNKSSSSIQPPLNSTASLQSSAGLPEVRVTPCQQFGIDDGQVCSSPIVGQLPSMSIPASSTSPHQTSTLNPHSFRDSHYKSSRPRSSSLHKYLPSPNDIAARGKDLLSRWKPMSYVAVPLHSPTPGPSTPSTAANVDFSEKSPRPLGSATAAAIAPVTPTAAELALPSAESPGVYSLVQPIGILAALFACSTCIVIFILSTVPVLSIPHNLTEVLDQAVALKQYANTSLANALHVLFSLSVLFVYKQAFSIPGSLLTNCLFGSLYGVAASTVLTSVLTAVGSMGCYFMARKTSPFFQWMFPKALTTLQNSINNSGDVFSHLLLIRLFPLLPYAMLNVAAGVIGVPAQPFFWTLVLGSAPFNAVTTQIGDLLASLPPGAAAGDLSSIWTASLCFKLLCISAVSALPVIFKKQIKQLLGSRSTSDDTTTTTNGSDSELSSNDPQSYELWAPHTMGRFTGRRKASVEDGSSAEEDDEQSSSWIPSSSHGRSGGDAAEMALLGATSSRLQHDGGPHSSSYLNFGRH